jgi:tetratricopeptide (TPR) repeat protein
MDNRTDNLKSIRNSGRTILLPLLLAFSMVLLLLLTGRPKPPVTLAPGDRIFIADIFDEAGASDAARQIGPLLRMVLEQSTRFVVYPHTTAKRLAENGQGEKDLQLNETNARVLCLKEGIPVLLLPRLRRLNNSFFLSGKLVDVKAGVESPELSFKVSDRTELAHATEEFGKELRKILGESRGPTGMFANILPRQGLRPSLDLFLRAIVCRENKDFDQELALLKRTVEVNPDFAIAQLRLGLLYARLRQSEAALQHVSQAQEHSQDLPTKQQYRIAGMLSLLHHRYADAAKEYSFYASVYPYDWHAQWGLGECAFMMGDSRHAIEAFQKAIQLDDSHVEIYLSLCMTALLNRDFGRAQEALRRAYRLEPNSPEVLLVQGFADLVENNFPSAIQAFQEFSQSPCCQSSGVFLLGQAQIYGGRFEAALRTLAAGMEADQKSRDTIREADKRLARAEIYLLLGNPSAAGSECRMVTGLGNDALRMAQLGSIYARIGQAAEARQVLNQVERLGANPATRPQTDLLRGEIQLAEGQLDQAIQSFVKARQSNEHPSEPLARAFKMANRLQLAQKEYALVCEQKTAMLFPGGQPWFFGTWVRALFDAGQCSMKLNRIDEAKQYFREYLWVLEGADTSLSSAQEARALLSGRKKRF